jgi:hypothetical protein
MSNPAMQLIEIHRDLNRRSGRAEVRPAGAYGVQPAGVRLSGVQGIPGALRDGRYPCNAHGNESGPPGHGPDRHSLRIGARVRDWMGLGDLGEGAIGKPGREHPKRPIQGFSCPRVEVSGDRLWGLMEQRYPDPADFFARHMVINYCPLVFMEDSGRNRTPDKLPAAEQAPLTEACDRALARQIEVIRPLLLIGVGKFAEKRLKDVASQNGFDLPVGSILHPSPASPAANRDWAGSATRQLADLGVWG